MTAEAEPEAPLTRLASRLAGRLALADRPTARRSGRLFNLVALYFRRFFCRHMNALRVARWGLPQVPAAAGPVVVYSNHPAWWDAVVYVVASGHFFPERETYAPIDAAMMAKYGVFGRIGAFGVDLDSPRGAARFLAASGDILADPRRMLWVTAQGRFVDARARPLGLKGGIARLAEIAPPETLFVPLALVYDFWQERGAEALIAFGPPLRGDDLARTGRPERRDALEAALAAALDRLCADAQTRDPARFVTVLEGRAGVGGVYDAWRWLTAALRGRRFDPAHARREPAVESPAPSESAG